jgi:cytosine/adenosine deaminase-related metal-dependent hydrolase
MIGPELCVPRPAEVDNPEVQAILDELYEARVQAQRAYRQALAPWQPPEDVLEAARQQWLRDYDAARRCYEEQIKKRAAFLKQLHVQLHNAETDEERIAADAAIKKPTAGNTVL